VSTIFSCCFFFIERSLSLTKAACIYILYDYKYSKNSTIVKYDFIFVVKAEFSASLLQSSVSHDPSQIIICWFAAQETYMTIMNVENCLPASSFRSNIQKNSIFKNENLGKRTGLSND